MNGDFDRGNELILCEGRSFSGNRDSELNTLLPDL